MKLAISSIAWSQEEEPAIASLLQELGVEQVELAPTKFWDNPPEASSAQIDEVLEFWSGHNIVPVAFQSMLFSHPDIKILQDANDRQTAISYLTGFIELAGKMGVGRMVFGSPKNRQRGELPLEEAQSIAANFFGQLGAVAQDNNVVFCIEPNPTDYACDFITTAAEGQALIEELHNPGLGLHLDLAGMHLAGDDVAASIRRAGPLLRHFHISSPFLGQVEEDPSLPHKQAAEALRDIGYNQTISIEMRPGDEGENVARVQKAVRFAQQMYL